MCPAGGTSRLFCRAELVMPLGHLSPHVCPRSPEVLHYNEAPRPDVITFFDFRIAEGQAFDGLDPTDIVSVINIPVR